MMLGFKPFGIPGRTLENIILHFDEWESFRLLDYEGLNQEEAAVRMVVSRPTLTRIYESARKKIATAFVEGKAIRIEGGEVTFDKAWFRCKHCHRLVSDTGAKTECIKTCSIDNSELEPIHGK
jgi:uncharacterized protein